MPETCVVSKVRTASLIPLKLILALKGLICRIPTPCGHMAAELPEASLQPVHALLMFRIDFLLTELRRLREVLLFVV